MEEAIKKVLDMLEEGKISPQEAKKLIWAIKETGKREKDREFSWWNLGGFISEIVGKSIKESLHSAFSFIGSGLERNIKMEIPMGERIKINSLGGDIEIKTEKRENVKLKADTGKYESREDELIIEIAGDGEIFIPENKDLEFHLLGGDATIKGNFRQIDFKIMGGDISAECEFESQNIQMFGGDFTLKTLRKPLKINAKILGGDFELPDVFKKEGNIYIYGESNYKIINLEMFGGDFELNFMEES